MRRLVLSAAFLGLFGCAQAPQSADCGSVRGLLRDALACQGRELRLPAYLTWTRHGSILGDRVRDSAVLAVEFPESPSHRETTQAILDEAYRSRSAPATLRGTFVGRLVTAGPRPVFEIQYGVDVKRVE